MNDIHGESAIGAQALSGNRSALSLAADSVSQVLLAPVDAVWRLQHANETSGNGSKSKPSTDASFAASERALHETTSQYIKEGAKTAALFLRGPAGLIGTAALFALDEYKPGEAPNLAGADLSLGLMKGAGLKLVFNKAGVLDGTMKFVPTALNLPARATILGGTSRLIDTALTRSTWQNPETGQVDPARAGKLVYSSVASFDALGLDIATFGASAGLAHGLNQLTAGRLLRSPLLSTMCMGGGMGLAGGAGQEFLRERNNNEKIDLLKISEKGMAQGAVDSIAAIPGGMQGEYQALKIRQDLSVKTNDRPSTARDLTSEIFKLPQLYRPEFSPHQHLHVAPSPAECACAMEADDLARMSIVEPKEPDAREKFARLSQPTMIDGSIEKAKATWTGKAANYAEYKKQAMEEIPVPMRSYKVKGHDFPVVIPEPYARKLDAVRARRYTLLDNKNLADAELTVPLRYLQRALPEDIVQKFDGVPNSKIIEQVNLFDHPLFTDNYYGFPAIAYTKEQQISFPQAANDSELRTTTDHEWSHALHNCLKEVFATYQMAVRLEDGPGKGYAARPYARRNEREDWAVHLGEEMLALGADKSFRLADNAPVRAVVLARALRHSLEVMPQAETSQFRDQYLARAKFIDEKFTPIAIKAICDNVGSDGLSSDQFGILRFLGDKTHVDYLVQQAAARPMFHDLAKQLVGTGMKWLDGDPAKQFDFLYSLSKPLFPEQGWQVAGASLRSFTPEMIESDYKAKLQTLRELRGREGNQNSAADNESFLRRGLGLVVWNRARGNYVAAESLAREAVAVGEKAFGEQDLRTCAAIEELARCLKSQGKYEESISCWERVIDGWEKNSLGPYGKVLRRNLQYEWDALATLHRGLEHNQEAVRCWQKAVRYAKAKEGETSQSAREYSEKISEVLLDDLATEAK